MRVVATPHPPIPSGRARVMGVRVRCAGPIPGTIETRLQYAFKLVCLATAGTLHYRRHANAKEAMHDDTFLFYARVRKMCLDVTPTSPPPEKAGPSHGGYGELRGLNTRHQLGS